MKFREKMDFHFKKNSSSIKAKALGIRFQCSVFGLQYIFYQQE